ncbi:MAG: hypothetical protein HY681_01580 [Chloroflexi bacterium]|nr:hypothetical protein [Chloroflexota bacterium]
MTRAFLLVACAAVAALTLAGCSTTPAQGNPSLPPGFQEAKAPDAGFSGYLYASQGSPVSLPTKWFVDLSGATSTLPFAAAGDSFEVAQLSVGAGPDIDSFGGNIVFESETEAGIATSALSTQHQVMVWQDGKDVGLVHGTGDWAAAAKGILQADGQATFAEAYPEAWDMLRMLPQAPPDPPVAAGFAKIEGGILEQASSRIQVGMEGVTQALGLLQVSQVSFIVYSAGNLSVKDTIGPEYLKERGISAAAAMHSGYPDVLLGTFLDAFASQAGLEKGNQIAGQDVLTRDVGAAYIIVKPVGNTVFLTVSPDRTKAEALMTAILEQQAKGKG